MRLQFARFQQSNASILAISSEDQERTSKLKEDLDLPFPLLSDSERHTIRDYGVFHDDEPKGRLISRPATFVLDPAGRIVYRYVGENYADRPETDKVMAAIPERLERESGTRSDPEVDETK